MGTEYYVACKACKVTRELGKFYASDCHNVNDRKSALEYAKRIEEDSFRAALLVSFMGEHRGHECTLFTEHDDHELDTDSDGFEGKEDTNYWREAAPPIKHKE